MQEHPDRDNATAEQGSPRLKAIRTTLVLLFLAVPALGGALSFLQVLYDNVDIAGLGGASGVAVPIDGGNVYVVGRDDDAIVTLIRDATNETLAPFRSFSSPALDGAAGIATSPDGRQVYITASIADSLLIFDRTLADGALGLDRAFTSGSNGVFGIGGAEGVTSSADGQHLYVTGRDDDALAVFSRDASTDEFEFTDVAQNLDNGVVGLDGATAVAVSPLGDRVFVASYDDGALAVFARDATLDYLAFEDAYFSGVDGISGLLLATSVAVSPDGKHVYVGSAGENAISAFDATGASLAFIDAYFDGQDGIDGLGGASSVVVSPDGDLVFVAGELDDAIAVFQRKPEDGSLIYLETVADGTAGVEGLDGPVSLAVSPDALHIYAAARESSSVVGLRRMDILFYDNFELDGTGRWSRTEP